jgi:hypothetical protein
MVTFVNGLELTRKAKLACEKKTDSSVGQAYLGLDIRFVTPRVGVTYSLIRDGYKDAAHKDVRRARNRRTYLPNSLVLDIL